MHVFCWHTICLLHPFFPHQSWNWDNRERRYGRLSECHPSSWLEKNRPSQSFFSGFWEVKRNGLAPRPSQTWGWWFPWVQHWWKSPVSSCSHSCASHCSATLIESGQLGSFLLPIFLGPGLLEALKRKLKWPTYAQVQDSLLKPRRRHIFREKFNCGSSRSRWIGRAI